MGIRGIATVRRNPNGPSRFTGNYFRWICETPDGVTYCDTRQSARNAARTYRAERLALLREGMKAQGHAEFYHG